jgi:hypothetical protein
MVCTKNGGPPNLTMAGCCGAGDICGADLTGTGIICVTPDQFSGLGFTCHPK